MLMDRSYSFLFGEIVETAKQAAGDNLLSVGVLFETENPDLKSWSGSGADKLYMSTEAVRDDADYTINRPFAESARDAAIKKHEEDLDLVRQGVFEHTDVGYGAVDHAGISAVYYDICEPVQSVMVASTLGKSIARITIVVFTPDNQDIYRKVQACVSVYLKSFLSKNKLGTPTSV